MILHSWHSCRAVGWCLISMRVSGVLENRSLEDDVKPQANSRLCGVLGSWLRSVAVVAVLLASAVPAGAQQLLVEFLDVGQGDAVLLRTPAGAMALVDGGPDAGVLTHLRRLGVTHLDLVVASHPHADHIGGLEAVLRSIPVANYMDNGAPHTTRTYNSLMRAVESSTSTRYLVATPRSLQLGDLTVRVLPIDGRLDGLNNRSVPLLVEFGEFRLWLSGDSEYDQLEALVRTQSLPSVSVLKVPHHGSSDAVSNAFLRATRPSFAVISVGAGNQFGHPSPKAVQAYRTLGTRVYRTDTMGSIRILASRDGSVRVEADRHHEVSPTSLTGSSSAQSGEFQLSVNADAPGNDHRNLNGEWVDVMNVTDRPIGLEGHRLCDVAGHCFEFPSGSRIGPGETIRLDTGSGQADARRLFMGSRSAVWNNGGDTATLIAPDGQVLAEYSYGGDGV